MRLGVVSAVVTRTLAAAVMLAAAGCATNRRATLFGTAAQPRVEAVVSADLPYFLAQMEVAAESPLPHERPADLDWNYKVMGATQQGSCVGGCPPSTILIAISNYTGRRPDVRLYRVDGIRFWVFREVTKYAAVRAGEPFLTFRVTSRRSPGECDDYEVRVSAEAAAVVPIGRNRDDRWCR